MKRKFESGHSVMQYGKYLIVVENHKSTKNFLTGASFLDIMM